jgi:hypothetical protein
METIGIKGILTIHEIPDWTDEEFVCHWARMSEGEKHSRQVPLADGRMRAENIITNAGITTILNNLSVTGQGNMQTFAQILSVGNGSITGVTRSDTSVVGDGFTSGARKVPASFTSTGFSTTITTNFASGDAVGTWTNIGIYSFNPSGPQNATTTAGTGQLSTHALFSFVKGGTSYAVNYIFLLSN